MCFMACLFSYHNLFPKVCADLNTGSLLARRVVLVLFRLLDCWRNLCLYLYGAEYFQNGCDSWGRGRRFSSLQVIAFSWPLRMSKYILWSIRKLLELAFVLSSLDMVAVRSIFKVLVFSISGWPSVRPVCHIQLLLSWCSTELIIFISAFLNGESSASCSSLLVWLLHDLTTVLSFLSSVSWLNISGLVQETEFAPSFVVSEVCKKGS